MTTYEFGDIVLVPFPFTDQSTSKKRPAVIVSGEIYHSTTRDLIILAITTQSGRRREIDRVVADWEEAGLLKPSLFKPTITTIDSKLVLRKLSGTSRNETRRR
jgi:mRNA interferase MazF